MIIINRINNIYVSVIEDVGYANSSYSIHPIDVSGCVLTTPILSGIIDSEKKATFELLDGIYMIRVTDPNLDFPVIEQEFIVLYNFLPMLICYIQDAICDCNDCKNQDEELCNNFYKTVIYLSFTNLFSQLSYLRFNNCKNFNILQLEEEKLKYYGKFNYDFVTKIKEFFAYLYVELYHMHTSYIKDVDDYNDSLINLFNHEAMKRCLYSHGYDIKDMLCEINKLNCDCDE